MKKSKLPANISLEYLINEVKKQEQKEKLAKKKNLITYIDGATNEIVQIINKFE